MSDKQKIASIDSNAIYYDVSPNIVILYRFFNFLTLLMAVISFVLCLVQGHQNQTYYLLACNTVISLFVGIVVNWWYRKGDLGPEKYWYIFLVGAVIMFQCVTTDMFVFHVLPQEEPKTHFTTPHPWPNLTTTPHSNRTSIFPAISLRTASTIRLG